MSTASTQFEDERRLYENIRKHHREALKREQVRLACGDQPGGISTILASARKTLASSLGIGRDATLQAPPSAPVEPVEQPAGVITSH